MKKRRRVENEKTKRNCLTHHHTTTMLATSHHDRISNVAIINHLIILMTASPSPLHLYLQKQQRKQSKELSVPASFSLLFAHARREKRGRSHAQLYLSLIHTPPTWISFKAKTGQLEPPWLLIAVLEWIQSWLCHSKFELIERIWFILLTLNHSEFDQRSTCGCLLLNSGSWWGHQP